MKATLLFSINRVFEGKKGESFRLYMDLYRLPMVSPGAQNLADYKMSWVFFDCNDPDQRILMDNHKPIGLHLHIHSGPQIPVIAQTIEEAQKIFAQKVKEIFDFDLEV